MCSAADYSLAASDTVATLGDSPAVADVRGVGFLAGVELAGGADAAKEAARKAWEGGVIVRQLGETLALSPPLIVWLNYAYGWHTTFLITGTLGFLWLALWLCFYYAPERHRWLARVAEWVRRGEAVFFCGN